MYSQISSTNPVTTILSEASDFIFSEGWAPTIWNIVSGLFLRLRGICHLQSVVQPLDFVMFSYFQRNIFYDYYSLMQSYHIFQPRLYEMIMICDSYLTIDLSNQYHLWKLIQLLGTPNNFNFVVFY